MSKNNADAEENESSEPESDSATTTDDGGDGASQSELGGASDAEGATKREPADSDDTRKSPQPFDHAKEVDSIISEIDGEAGDHTDDEDATDSADKTKAADDDKANDETKSDSDKADATDEDKADTKEADPEKDADDEKPKPDPDEPTEEALSKYPKDARKQIKRAWNKVRELSEPAKFGERVSKFAQTNNIQPEALRDGLTLIADVIRAKDPEAAFDRLADEAISLVEDKNPEDMTPKEKAAVLRRMALRLDPEEVKESAPEEVKLPEALQDLVDTGELSPKAALAAHKAALEEKKPQRKETPPPARETKPANGAADVARSALAAREARGRIEVQKIQAELAATHKETWAKIMPVVKAAISKYPGLPPESWGQLVRDQTAIAAKRFEQPVKKMGRTLTPSRGKSTSDSRDDLDKILDEA